MIDGTENLKFANAQRDTENFAVKVKQWELL